MARARIVSGFHAIEEGLRSGSFKGEVVYFKKNPRINQILDLAADKGVAVRRVSRETLEKMADGAEQRGILLLAEGAGERKKGLDYHEHLARLDAAEEALVLLLDEVTDPHNLGAILRSADLFDVDLVVLPQRRSAGENATVRNTSAGASSYVPTARVPNLARALEDLKEAGFWIYGAQAEGTAAEDISFSGKKPIVMGSEGRGLRRLVSKGCDDFVSIPMGGHIDSLNVSVATGIILYEIRRQGRAKNR